MTSKNKKTDGPSCACGKTDLYEEWKKVNEKTEGEDSDNDRGKKGKKEAAPEE